VAKKLFHSVSSRARGLSKISEKYETKIDDDHSSASRDVSSPPPPSLPKGGGNSSLRSSSSTSMLGGARERTSSPVRRSFTSSEQRGGSSSSLSSLGAKASINENAEPYCNIKYSRLLELAITNDGKVHYSYCFLGVLRKLILLEHFASSPGKLRTNDLSKALKSLENIMIPSPSSAGGGGDSLAGDKEMKRLEEKHLEKVNKTNKKRIIAQMGKEGHIGDGTEMLDLKLTFTEMLAATKIQRIFKKRREAARSAIRSEP